MDAAKSPAHIPAAMTGVSKGSGQFRADVEGLRAVAVTLVLLFHSGLPFLPGGFIGVDVFFVISGFLITTQLVSELSRTKTISLVRFYARRAKRLLPAAGLVLATTFVLGRLVLPKTRWEEVGGDILGSALYVVNWRLADRSVDYLAEDSVPSPVQHFWSLAVEEQYYLVWPVLILLAVAAAKLLRKRQMPVLGIGLAVVVIPSFVWSVAATAESPTRAFFETTTRMWELGIGAAVALGTALWSRLTRRWAIGIGWAGLAAIAASGLEVTADTPWPGYAAALPTIGAAAVILAGFAASRGGPARLLGTRPFRWVGGLSYSLYLWHWPMLVFATAYFGALSTLQGVVLVGFSVLPAWVTNQLVENPIRYSAAVSHSARLALSLGANFTLVGVAAGLTLMMAAQPSALPGGSPLRNAAEGAAVLRDEPRDDPTGAPVDSVAWMTPLPAQATKDVPVEYANGCQQSTPRTDVVVCEAGDPHGTTTVAIVGDSKATQWMPALRLLAEQNHWRAVTYLKSSCSFALVLIPYYQERYEACRTWTNSVLDRLKSNPPDYVITSQGQSKGFEDDGTISREAMADGLRRAWRELTAEGSKVLVIADNAPPGMNVYECVEQHQAHLSECAFDRKRYDWGAATVQHEAARGLAGVGVVDMFDAICPTEQCAPVIGNVLIYRQGSHLTKTYVETLTPRLATSLSAAGMPATYRPGD